MEKQKFRLRFGYLHIDAENIYITRSGGWFEAYDLDEKSKPAKAFGQALLEGTIVFSMLVIFVWLVNRFLGLDDDPLAVGFPSLVVAILIELMNVFTRLVTPFKIPRHKLKSFEVEGRKLKITFENANGKTDEVKLNGLRPSKLEQVQAMLLNT